MCKLNVHHIVMFSAPYINFQSEGVFTMKKFISHETFFIPYDF